MEIHEIMAEGVRGARILGRGKFFGVAMLGCACWLAGAPALVADDGGNGEGAEVAAEVRDFGDGFARFHKLGLPMAAGAKYVKLDERMGGGNLWQMLHGNFYLGHELKLSGNAWLIEEGGEDSPAKFIVGNCRLVEVYDHKVLHKLIQEEREAEGGKNARRRILDFSREAKGRMSGAWSDADAKADADKILKFIDEKSSGDRGIRSISHGNNLGNLFLTAAHFYANGLEEEGNAIVGKLFEASGDRRKVLGEALNVLADSQYEEKVDAFFRHGDWNALAADLLALLQKFTAGWSKAPAVKILLDNVAARVADGTPPPIDGEGLTDEDRRLADALANMRGDEFDRNQFRFGRHGQRGLWILSSGSASEDPIRAITNRGVDAIPLLLALLEDEYLVAGISRNDIQSGSFRSHRSSMSEELLHRAAYDSLHRPASRGDIAFSLLSKLPMEMEESRHRSWSSADELRHACMDLYESIQGKTGAEIARMYMESHGDEQRSSALRYLVANGTEEDMAAVEEMLLDPEKFQHNFQTIQLFVENRQERAAEFVGKLEQALTSGGEDDEDTNGEEVDGEFFAASGGGSSNHGWMLKSLRDIVNVRPAAELLAAIAAGEESAAENQNALARALGREEAGQALTLLLEAAKNSKDPDTAILLVSFTGRLPMVMMMSRGFRSQMDDDSDDDEEETSIFGDIGAHAELWKSLLADGRTAGSFMRKIHSGTYLSNGLDLGTVAAWMIELAYGDEESKRRANTEMGLLGANVFPLARERAAARLEGKSDAELPPWPDAAKVPEGRIDEIVASVKAAAGPAAVELARALSLDEQMALLNNFPDDPEFRGKVLPAANTVVNIECLDMPAESIAAVKAFEGKPLDRGMLDEIIAICEREIRAGDLVFANINRWPGFQGVEISIAKVVPGSDEFNNNLEQLRPILPRDGQASIGGMFSVSRGASARATWRPDAEEADNNDKNAESAAAEDDIEAMLMAAVGEIAAERVGERERERENLWINIDEFLQGAGNPAAAAIIRFRGAPAMPAENGGE